MADNFMLIPSALGWMGIAGAGAQVRCLVFGHADPSAAHRALIERGWRDGLRHQSWNRDLANRLQRYADGQEVSFDDIEVVMDRLRPFTRRVLEHCRRIPWGSTISYRQLAITCGHPQAARAVGTAMACNPVPLVIPCHRVVASDGSLGGYSAPGGLQTKRRLLRQEGRLFGPRAAARRRRRVALRRSDGGSGEAAVVGAVS